MDWSVGLVALGSDQVNLLILCFMLFKTMGFHRQYCSFQHQKQHNRVTGFHEVQIALATKIFYILHFRSKNKAIALK